MRFWLSLIPLGQIFLSYFSECSPIYLISLPNFLVFICSSIKNFKLAVTIFNNSKKFQHFLIFFSFWILLFLFFIFFILGLRLRGFGFMDLGFGVFKKRAFLGFLNHWIQKVFSQKGFCFFKSLSFKGFQKIFVFLFWLGISGFLEVVSW